MKKRICAFLAALLLVGTLFVPVRAEELSKEDAVMAEAKSIYRASRRSAGKSSFSLQIAPGEFAIVDISL